MIDLPKISATLIESLKTLGLTEYEAKVYSGLVQFDQAEVKQIYEYLEIPKPSVYQSLKTLTDKGLVQIVSSRPAIYRATPPKIALRHMTDVHRKAEDDAMLELEELEKSPLGPGIPQRALDAVRPGERGAQARGDVRRRQPFGQGDPAG